LKASHSCAPSAAEWRCFACEAEPFRRQRRNVCSAPLTRTLLRAPRMTICSRRPGASPRASPRTAVDCALVSGGSRPLDLHRRPCCHRQSDTAGNDDRHLHTVRPRGEGPGSVRQMSGRKGRPAGHWRFADGKRFVGCECGTAGLARSRG
jgi:hypothetical protein